MIGDIKFCECSRLRVLYIYIYNNGENLIKLKFSS